MAVSEQIPSTVNTSNTVTLDNTPLSGVAGQHFLYITAIMEDSEIDITLPDGSTPSVGGESAVSFNSPIQCTQFDANAPGEVAYYVQ